MVKKHFHKNEDFDKTRRRVSSLPGAAAPVLPNQCCQSLTPVLPKNDQHIIRDPHIVPVMWGHYYATNPAVVTALVSLLTDLVTGQFMNGLAQYGCLRGDFRYSSVFGNGPVFNPQLIDIIPPNKGPTNVGDTGLSQLKNWLDAGKVGPVPQDGFEHDQLVYIVFLPTETTISTGVGG